MGATDERRTLRDIETLREWIANTSTDNGDGSSDRSNSGNGRAAATDGIGRATATGGNKRAAATGGMVFFGGAGVSTESGIPDFRSPNGLYAQKYPYPPETMVSRSFFDAHTPAFYDFYCDRMLALDARPNQAHRKLAELERAGILSAVVTQNIDGLHQQAGSRTVFELHGSVHRNFCCDCHAPYTVQQLLELRERASDGVPRCPVCDGVVKPDVVLYEEPLDDATVSAAVRAIAQADLLVIAGTSLSVYPAAGLVDYFQGSHLVIVNRTPTPRDRHADLCIAANIGEVLDF